MSSESDVQVVRLGEVLPHPNADRLELTTVNGNPVCMRKGEFKAGDLVTYVPIDSVVPDTIDWAFLLGHRRIKARRLRGVFSMGLLCPPPAGAAEGDDVAEQLGITKYEPACEEGSAYMRGPRVPAVGAIAGPPGLSVPKYDLESLRKWREVLEPDTRVLVTEKIHGANARFLYDGTRFWAGSRSNWWDTTMAGNMWVAVLETLKDKLVDIPGVVVYGEVFGQVQDLKYGAGPGEFRFAAFDALRDGAWLAAVDRCALLSACAIPQVPELYVGAMSGVADDLAEGPSVISRANHCREGFVVEPADELMVHPHLGRVKLKLVGQEYLLRA